MSDAPNSLFAITDSFDQAAENATGFGDQKKRRDSWPIVRPRKVQNGNEEMLLRILPFQTSEVAGYWLKTPKNKTFWLDSPAWDPKTKTMNGPDPIAEVGAAKLTHRTIAYAIDMFAAQELASMGVQQWTPAKPDATVIPHPLRVAEFSGSVMQQIKETAAMKGKAGDKDKGYIIKVVKSSKGGNSSYQVIAGDIYPITDQFIAALPTLNLPNVSDYHEPDSIDRCVMTLLFNNHISYEKGVAMLEKYKEQSLISQEAVATTVKAMTTFATKRGLIGTAPVAGLGTPGLAAPGLPAPGLAAPGLPAPGMMGVPMGMPPVGFPGTTPMAPPQAPVFPQMPLSGAPMGFPGAPMGFPGASITVGVSQAPAQAPAAPMAPPAPSFGFPGLPQMPSVSQAPAAPFGLAPAPPQIPGIPVPQIPGVQMPQMPQIPVTPIGNMGIIE
jgi:hypothetical protein